MNTWFQILLGLFFVLEKTIYTQAEFFFFFCIRLRVYINRPNIQLYNLKTLIKSKIRVNYKMLIERYVIRSVWSNRIQILSPPNSFNIHPLQAIQSINLKIITEVPWYITKRNLQLSTLIKLTKNNYKIFHIKLLSLQNLPINYKFSVYLPENIQRLLQCNWILEFYSDYK